LNSNERAYKTRAIVLRARNLGEADRIYTLFTESRGKVDAVAKGVRRTKSHIAGRLEFMSEAMLTLHRGRNLDVVTSADIVVTEWPGLVRPGAYAAAHLVAELVDSFCEPDLAMPEAYALLRGAAFGIARSDDPAGLVPRFQLRFLDVLGLGPPSDVCVRCGGAFGEGEAWADLDSGGLSCGGCRPHHSDGLALAREDLASFRALGTPRSKAGPSSLRATPAAARAIDAFISHHLGKRPKSALYLAELAQVRSSVPR
jgi:DNA repair protein RecO (recombination protein O)